MLSLTACVILSSNSYSTLSYLESIATYFDEIVVVSSVDYDVSGYQGYAPIKQVRIESITVESMNEVIKGIDSDWILWLKEHEQIEEQDLYRLRDWLYYTEGKIGLVQHLSPRQQVGAMFKTCDVPLPRILSKGTSFSYYDEYVLLVNYDSELSHQMETVFQLCPITIKHNQKPLMNNKVITMLIQNLEYSLTSMKNITPYTYYQLAYESYRLQKNKKSLHYINEAITLFAEQEIVPPHYIYKLKYSCLLEFNYDEDTVRGLHLVTQLYPEHTELTFYLGILYFKQNKFNEAKPYFYKCIELGEGKSELCRQGTGTYLASLYVGLCYEKLEQADKAIQYFENALVVRKGYKAAINALNRVKNEENLNV